MRTYKIYNLNLEVATVKATSENEALKKYATGRSVYYNTINNYKAKEV